MNPPSHARHAPILLVLLLALAIPACDSDPPTTPTLPEGEVTPTPIYASSNSGLTESERRVVRQQSAYEALWQDIFSNGTTPPTRPAVDFNQDMVLAVASGEQPQSCYSIAITQATADGTDLTVTVTETGPAAGCMCADAIVQPVEVVAVPRADEVLFREVTATACPG